MIVSSRVGSQAHSDNGLTSLVRIPLSRIFTKEARRTLVLCSGVCVYRILLDWLYFENLAPRATEYPDYRDVSLLIMSWLAVFCSLPLINKIIHGSDRDSSLTLTGLYFLSYIPFTTCIYAGMFVLPLILYGLAFWFIFFAVYCWQLETPLKPLPKITLGRIRFDDSMLKIMGVMCVFTVVYISWRYTHFRLHFSIWDVYDLRMEAREYGYPRLLSFLLQWSRKINPLMCVYYILKKNYKLAVIFFLVQILCFGIEAHKSELFFAFVAIAILPVRRSTTATQFKYIIMIGSLCLIVFAIFEIILLRSEILLQLLVRRIMFVPNSLHRYYYDYFVTLGHELTYFRNDLIYFFGKFYGVTNPYIDEVIPRIIGRIYFNSLGNNANNGTFSQGAWELGGLGAFIIPFVLLFWLWLYDRSVEGLNSREMLGLSTTYTMQRVMMMISGGTSLVSLDMLIIISLMSMVNRGRDYYNNTKPADT